VGEGHPVVFPFKVMAFGHSKDKSVDCPKVKMIQLNMREHLDADRVIIHMPAH